MAKVSYKTEDQVRDGAKIILGFDKTEEKVQQGTVPVHNDWAAAYYIIVFCELIPRTDTEDIRNPLLSSLRKAQSAGPRC